MRKPIVGTMRLLDQAQCQEVFEKYQRTPEYQKINRGMSLDEFKGIFHWPPAVSCQRQKSTEAVWKRPSDFWWWERTSRKSARAGV